MSGLGRSGLSTDAPRWFDEAEVKGLNPNLIRMLDRARGLAKVPFIITSGVRTREENELAGGAPNSAHLRGLAVDLRCHNSWTRFRMVPALYMAGFRRMVLYAGDGHIHVDADAELEQDVMVVKP